MSGFNPNSDKDYIDKLNLSDEKTFPKFLKCLEFRPFKHISNLKVDFIHPVSVITGTNRSGKSTILMALACSHIKFDKQDIKNGNMRRHTWRDLMLFTNHDRQTEDWNYDIIYKLGSKEVRKNGYRRCSTKKWGGVGTKKAQFPDRQVVFIDMNRILPARNFNSGVYWKAKTGKPLSVSNTNQKIITDYFSYVLEEDFDLNRVGHHIDKDVYKYTNSNEYSSYNAASGEEVLSKIIIDLVEAEQGSLILIDEIEIGLHPKVQRRLMQVIYHIARKDNKQFIITTHSPSILSSVPDKARIFIEKTYDGHYQVIPNISINAALSKMDSESYPLVNLFCEDDVAHFIIDKAISEIQKTKARNFSNLVNIIEVGSVDKTYNCFQYHKNTYEKKKVKTGYACILDGDMKDKNKDGKLLYPIEDCLHFLYSRLAPEKFLVDEYIKAYPNPTLRFHVDKSNPHCLFEKMKENSIGTSKKEAFEICWEYFISTAVGKSYFEELQKFIIDTAKKFSPDL